MGRNITNLVGSVALSGSLLVAVLPATAANVSAAATAEHNFTASSEARKPTVGVVNGKRTQLSPSTRTNMQAVPPGENRLVTICNFSNGTVIFAMGQNFVQKRFASRGWWTLKNEECQTHGVRYLLVMSASNRNVKWYISSSRQMLCIKWTGPYAIYGPESTRSCDDVGGTMALFAKVPAGSGTYRWTLLPRA